MTTSKLRGFTLVELMFVVAILGVLSVVAVAS
ncbi:MAG TPA: prepilin-type N-terminal cleavage/methylation domain-containing protein, partial [Myxococcota bacterium]|nr:prepilin-type N-terminal cleavage/methylation domain-containing protein [Myxococcota bacterium]